MFYYNVLMDLDNRMTVQEGYTGRGKQRGDSGQAEESISAARRACQCRATPLRDRGRNGSRGERQNGSPISIHVKTVK